MIENKANSPFSPNDIVGAQLVLPCICCLVNPIGIWCFICLRGPRFTLGERAIPQVSQSLLKQLSTSAWFRKASVKVANKLNENCGCDHTQNMVKEVIPSRAKGKTWTLDWNKCDGVLTLTNKGERADTALLLIGAFDPKTQRAFHVELPIEKATSEVEAGAVRKIQLPEIELFKDWGFTIEMTVFSAKEVALNGDGIASVLLQNS